MRRLSLGVAVLALGVGLHWVLESKPSRALARARTGLVLDDVMVINPGLGRVSHQRVEVRDGRIAAIEPTRNPSSARRYLLPGLIDMHVHLPPRAVPGMAELFAALFLSNGVTTVREVGSIDGTSFRIAEEIQVGERAGPRVLGCGPILDGDPPTWPVARAVRDHEDGEQAVRELAAQGAACVKVYDGVSAAALAGIRGAARRHGLSVVGHLPSSLPVSDPRVDDVQHLCYSRCSDLTADEINALVDGSAESDVAHTPTLVVYEGQVRLAELGDAAAATRREAMPRFWRETLWSHMFAVGSRSSIAVHGEGLLRQRRGMLDGMKALVGRLHRRGVRIHAGTDPFQPYVTPGESLHRELELLVDSGLSTEEALAAATSVAGDSLGTEGLGRLRVGAPADFLVLREDPTQDLGALETLEVVVADGRVYPIGALRSAADELRQDLDRPLPRFVLGGVSKLGLAVARHAFGVADQEDTP